MFYFFIEYDLFRQRQWHTSCRSRRKLSNAIVKSDIRLTGVEIWLFPFRKGVILYGELAKGGWENQGNRAGGTEGAAFLAKQQFCLFKSTSGPAHKLALPLILSSLYVSVFTLFVFSY